MAALFRQPPHFHGGLLRIPKRQDAQRNESAGIRATPFVDVPVVVGAHVDERLRLSGALMKRPPSMPAKLGN